MEITYSRLILNVSTMEYEYRLFKDTFNSRNELYNKHPDASIVSINTNNLNNHE